MTHRIILVPHAEYGFWFVPNQYAYVAHPDRAYYVVQTNSIGIRSDREFSFEKSPDVYRILVFGDSFTAADGVDNAERYSDILESLDSRLEVMNFGLPASGTDQQLLLFERLARNYQADMLLICPMVENIRRNLTRYRSAIDRTTGELILVPKPYFVLEAGQLVLHKATTERPVPFHRATEEMKHTSMVQTSGFKNPRTILGKLALVMERFSGGVLSPLVKSAVKLKHPHPYFEYDSASHPAWRLMCSILESFIDHAKDLDVVLVPLPSYEYIEGSNGQPSYLDRFQELAALHDAVSLINVLSEMRRSNARHTFRYAKDTHYTPRAHRLIAQVLYDTCIEQKVESKLN